MDEWKRAQSEIAAEEETSLPRTDSAGYIDGESGDDDDDKAAIQVSVDFFDERILRNLDQVLANKGRLIRDALGAKSLDYTVGEEFVSFPWFTITDEASADAEIRAYTDFINALLHWAAERKRVNNVIDNSQNERYAFRCFLLRLGLIGEEYRETRRILLCRLDGDSAFKDGRKEKR